MTQPANTLAAVDNIIAVVDAHFAGSDKKADVFMFAFSLQLRKMIVKDRFYRQTLEKQAEMLTDLAARINHFYQQPEMPLVSTHIFNVLVAAKGVHWANTVYALASPALYVKNIKRFFSYILPTESYIPFFGLVAVDSTEQLMTLWNEVAQKFVVACPADAVYKAIASVIHGNVKMSEMFNAFAPEQWAIEVYDEDAVPAQPEVFNMPAGESITWPVEQTEAGFNADMSGDVDDEEADFNRRNEE
jgi:hypothetical protein